MQNFPNLQTPFPLGFEIYDLRATAKRRFLEYGEEAVKEYLAVLIRDGSKTFFEDLWEAVRFIVDGYHFEQCVSDVLAKYEGVLWERWNGDHYRPIG
ncbi:hypothetical protein [Croceicoccus marinus]|nr:hypothetical protein [Croceicoccus marinus]